ncbi:hypothetical protein DFS33DRAFT_1269020 [Desarmillaria ectypa]|nr:hypothetical protein DFS33DRAFT_1269020 [Desarmillaria ectypa]
MRTSDTAVQGTSGIRISSRMGYRADGHMRYQKIEWWVATYTLTTQTEAGKTDTDIETERGLGTKKTLEINSPDMTEKRRAALTGHAPLILGLNEEQSLNPELSDAATSSVMTYPDDLKTSLCNTRAGFGLTVMCMMEAYAAYKNYSREVNDEPYLFQIDQHSTNVIQVHLRPRRAVLLLVNLQTTGRRLSRDVEKEIDERGRRRSMTVLRRSVRLMKRGQDTQDSRHQLRRNWKDPE